MEPVRRVKDLEQDVVRGEAKVKAEAEWADPTPPVRAEVAYVRTVRPSFLMWPAGLATREIVQNVVQK